MSDQDKRRIYTQALQEARRDLNAIKMKHDALQSAVTHLEKLIELLPREQTEGVGLDSFKGLTHKQACIKVLYNATAPMTTREIADTIEQGGYEHESANFWNSTNTALTRLKEDQWIAKTENGWVITDEGRTKAEGNQDLTLPF